MRRLVTFFSNGSGGGPVILAGDAIGPAGANTVVKIQNEPWSAAAPAVNDVPIWSGAAWVPGPQSGGGSATPRLYFEINGDVITFPTGQPLDGQKEPGATTVLSIVVRQRVDSSGAGAGGTTTGTVYKRTSSVARVPVGTFSIAQGVGDNYRTTATLTGVGADKIFAATDCAEVELDTLMTDGVTTQSSDISICVIGS